MTTDDHRIKIRTHECDDCKANGTVVVVRGYTGLGTIFHEGIPSCTDVNYCPYCGASLGWHRREEK